MAVDRATSLPGRAASVNATSEWHGEELYPRESSGEKPLWLKTCPAYGSERNAPGAGKWLSKRVKGIWLRAWIVVTLLVLVIVPKRSR